VCYRRLQGMNLRDALVRHSYKSLGRITLNPQNDTVTNRTYSQVSFSRSTSLV